MGKGKKEGWYVRLGVRLVISQGCLRWLWGGHLKGQSGSEMTALSEGADLQHPQSLGDGKAVS